MLKVLLVALFAVAVFLVLWCRNHSTKGRRWWKKDHRLVVVEPNRVEPSRVRGKGMRHTGGPGWDFSKEIEFWWIPEWIPWDRAITLWWLWRREPRIYVPYSYDTESRLLRCLYHEDGHPPQWKKRGRVGFLRTYFGSPEGQLRLEAPCFARNVAWWWAEGYAKVNHRTTGDLVGVDEAYARQMRETYNRIDEVAHEIVLVELRRELRLMQAQAPTP